MWVEFADYSIDPALLVTVCICYVIHTVGILCYVFVHVGLG